MSFTCTECEVPQTYKPGPICYVCASWLARIERKSNPYFVIVDHHFYVISDVTPGKEDSRKRIQFKDGRLAVVYDFYDHGVIPERFRDRLPDNAEFVS